MYCVHRNKNQQITWHLVEVNALCSFLYTPKYLQISESTLYNGYRLALWGQAVQSNLILIRSWYYNSVRTASSILHGSNLMLFLMFLYFKPICIKMHAVFNNKASLNISSLVTLVSDTHYYNTRFSRASTFSIQNSRTQQRIKSSSCTGLRREIVFLLIFVHY